MPPGHGTIEIVDLYSPYDLQNLNESDAIFKAGIRDHEIIMYNGHSYYGSLDMLEDCSNYPADTYQIFFMGSCWSYEYYTSQIFACKANQDGSIKLQD